MSNLMFGPDIPVKFVDKRKSGGQTSTTSLATPLEYTSQSALDTRLSALGYADATIRQMTLNDKVFAVRSADDAGSI